MKVLAALLGFLAFPALAADRADLFDLWGNERQCAGLPILPGGTRKASAFEIGEDWIAQGGIWCRLEWFPVSPRDGGLFTTARAQCGEDSVQGYRLDMHLADGVLHLIWDESLLNGPLRRCAADTG